MQFSIGDLCAEKSNDKSFDVISPAVPKAVHGRFFVFSYLGVFTMSVLDEVRSSGIVNHNYHYDSLFSSMDLVGALGKLEGFQ